MSDKKIEIPKKLYLYDPGYTVRMKGGWEATQDFKNVYITDHPDMNNTPGIFLPFRVMKETEEADMLVATILTESIEKYHNEQAKAKRKTKRK